MLTSQSVGEHLPVLRRYARALTGSQKSGDSYVAAALETLISQDDVIDEETPVRVGMFRVFSKIWNSVGVNAGKDPVQLHSSDAGGTVTSVARDEQVLLVFGQQGEHFGVIAEAPELGQSLRLTLPRSLLTAAEEPGDDDSGQTPPADDEAPLDLSPRDGHPNGS